MTFEIAISILVAVQGVVIIWLCLERDTLTDDVNYLEDRLNTHIHHLATHSTTDLPQFMIKEKS